MNPQIRTCASKGCGQQATKSIDRPSGGAVLLCATHAQQTVACPGCRTFVEVAGVEVRPNQRYTYSGLQVCNDCRRSSTLRCGACLTPVGQPTDLFHGTVPWEGSNKGVVAGYRCSYCGTDDIQNLAQANPLIGEAVQWFQTWLSGLGFPFPDLTGRIIYKVAADDALAAHGSDNGNVQGLTLTQSAGSKPKQYTVYVIVGVRKITFMEVLLHELAHVWTNDKDYNNSDFIEGFCNLVAYTYLEELSRIGATPEIRAEASERIALLKADASPIYGSNFNAFRMMAGNSPNIVRRYLDTVKPKS
ncbi:hypothetical protein GCM10010112_69750 [Actinoplanes lobatus]|uniref:Transposase-like protein n=1 Tax=Actinoplanes lobatus TaxID=113568 RepID=A0A7W7MK20_9ACTN|nr:hypothetical protein [Actinoplanes lobatus]MBB4753048.1 transposase-like protein [Actinoplanes lobatus]GGN87284.1 hypothetical protein GCM10010112_69750 [Actinoplanes lobatus]GIE39655.1 hypothetical protein Alo02nite_25530 [Actinoplanes lobatus]